MRSTLRRMSGIAAIAFVSTTGLGQSNPRPILVTLHGKDNVRIRLAVGPSAPCNSAENQVIYDGPIEAGKTKAFSVAADCVCFQQTFAPFSGVDWSQAKFHCVPLVCNTFNGLPAKGAICRPAPDPTIRIALRSSR